MSGPRGFLRHPRQEPPREHLRTRVRHRREYGHCRSRGAGAADPTVRTPAVFPVSSVGGESLPDKAPAAAGIGS